MKIQKNNDFVSYSNRLKAANIVGTSFSQCYKGFLSQYVFISPDLLQNFINSGKISESESKYIKARAKFIAAALKEDKGFFNAIRQYVCNRYEDGAPKSGKAYSAYYFAQAVEARAKHILFESGSLAFPSSLTKKALYMLFIERAFRKGATIAEVTATDVATFAAEDTPDAPDTPDTPDAPDTNK